MLWRGDRGLTLALTVACRFAKYAEFLILLWPNPRAYSLPSSALSLSLSFICNAADSLPSPGLRMIWQQIRFVLVESCLSAGVTPPSASLPVAPIQPEAGPSSAGSSSAGSSTGANAYRGNVVQES